MVPGVCTVHRLVLTPTVATFEHHGALCSPIKFLYLGLCRLALARGLSLGRLARTRLGRRAPLAR